MPRTMQYLDRQVLFDAVEQVDGASLYQPERGYSGRGMDGERCLGVILESMASLGELAAELTATYLDAQQVNCGVVEPYEDSEEIRRMIRRARTDSLGRSIIVYFPGWQLAGVTS